MGNAFADGFGTPRKQEPKALSVKDMFSEKKEPNPEIEPFKLTVVNDTDRVIQVIHADGQLQRLQPGDKFMYPYGHQWLVCHTLIDTIRIVPSSYYSMYVSGIEGGNPEIYRVIETWETRWFRSYVMSEPKPGPFVLQPSIAALRDLFPEAKLSDLVPSEPDHGLVSYDILNRNFEARCRYH